ncbi:MAG: hypothetical protein ACOYNC_02690 [Bacteroidales bacterium]
MKIVQRIGTVLVLLVFLFGTTGISVFHHICNSSRQDNASVYPEIFVRAGTSCCVDESTGYTCAGHDHASQEISDHQTVDAIPCCKSIVSFFRLEVLTVRAEKLVLAFNQAPLAQYPVILTEKSTPEQPGVQPSHYQFYSPPLFGRVLVYFLHQIKIPVHHSIA